MKNITKILAVLLCLSMLFALCACGGDDKDTEGGKESTSVTDTEKNTDKETENTSGNTEKETGDDDIVLPEDGKIEFGKDNNKSEETAKPADGGSSTGGNPGDDNGWGDVNWNN